MPRRVSSPDQLALDFTEPFRNRGLFAEHFLRNRLGELPAWHDDSGLDATLAAMRELYRPSATFSEATNEQQTEHQLIRPILNLLWSEGSPGDCYEVQVRLPNLGATARQPDYALFGSAADRDAAEPAKGTLDYWQSVAVVADAKRWSGSLDKQRGDENPSAQLANYLYRSRVGWGILTNGRWWRLYERERSSIGGVWFEVNLDAALGNRDAFRWFHHFFRRGAFLPDASGSSFVEQVLAGSVTYATDVGNRLKESVYDALRLLVNGFLELAANGLDRHDATTLERVHDNALIVLYRLLFVLYAEDRGLLPCAREPYRDHSLRRLHQEVNARLRGGGGYLPVTHQLWDRLRGLFELIDQGYPAGGIPAYNGGLFSPARHPELASTGWQLGDHRAAEVIDLLAYDRRPGARAGHGDIDYTTLEVQHLGGIYEGLLELRPKLAAAELVEVTRGGRSLFEPADTVARPAPGARRIAAGEIYLVTDRGERKATGSFYTPKAIVDYIVEHTIGPLTNAAAEAVAGLRPAIDAEIAALEARRADLAASRFETQRREAEAIPAAIEAARRRLLEPYLSLTILDPAMGSGHFLVGAADFLGLAMATDPHLPVLDAQGDEDPQLFFKRLVVERCLYGVDLNPLAVELAKLSLWLHTVSGDRALSFLDHHLRCGNSLVGARLIEDLGSAVPRLDAKGAVKRDASRQLSLAFVQTLEHEHLKTLLDTFRDIAESPSGQAETERAKARWFDDMDRVRDRFRQVAALWLAPFFGHAVDDGQYGRAVDSLRREDDFQRLAAEPWFAAARQAVGGRRCFCWELEFPEAFLLPTGPKPPAERGFDAVIGNPPYVRQEQLGELKPYWRDRYPAVYHGMADLFVYFFGRGLELLRPERRLSYVSSNAWLQTAYAEPLRRHVRAGYRVETLIDLGNNRTFAEAPDVCPSIFVIARTAPEAGHRMACAAFARGEPPRLDGPTLRAKLLGVTQADQPDTGWQLTDDATRRLVAKLLNAGRPLGEVVGGRMYRGVLTGLNEAFIVDQSTRDRLIAEDAGSTEILKPLVRGEDLRPWYQEDEGRWLIFARRGIEIERYPAVLRWLSAFRERLEPRPTDWIGKDWPGRKPGDYAWYEIQDTVAYHAAFEQPKIFWPDICKIPRFSAAAAGVHGSNTTYFTPCGSWGLLSFLQSRCAWMLVSNVCLHNKFREGLWEYRLFTQFLGRLPVPDGVASDEAPLGATSERVTAAARDRYALHRRVRHRLLTDLAPAGAGLNQKLTAWWQLDFSALRAELRKAWKTDVEVQERDQWERWLADARAEHQGLTARIVDLEGELNDRVYRLYDLTREEIALVERVTKYDPGEV